MTDAATATTALAVFGDPNGELWAVLVGGQQPRLAIGPVDASGPGNPTGAAPEWIAVEVDPDDGQVWSVQSPNGSGDGAGAPRTSVDLRIEVAGASSYTYEDGSALQPCRLSGTVALNGVNVNLDVPGVLMEDLPTGKIDSIRVLGSWFPGGHEISLLSVRPRGAKGQDGDLVDVVARGEQQKIVFDPRLSTTYGPDGLPRKASIELWLGDDEEGEQFPRRVSGVASGAAAPDAEQLLSGFTLQAHALHCLSRGEEGGGVYMLLRAEG